MKYLSNYFEVDEILYKHFRQANLTCIESASTSECTATVLIPHSLHARITLTAISPLLAIKTF